MASAKKSRNNTINIHLIGVGNNIINPSKDNTNTTKKCANSPFSATLGNKLPSISQSMPLSRFIRLLDNLQPSQQQQLIQQTVTEKINTVKPCINTSEKTEIIAMILGLERKEILHLLSDDTVLMDKINGSPPTTPPPSNTKKCIKYNQESINPNISCLSSDKSPYKKGKIRKKYEKNSKEDEWNRYQELESKYEALQQEHIKLQCILKYSSWKWYDIYQWIINLNNKQFIKYNKSLYNNLKMHYVDGKDLRCLNEDDWHQLGIKDKQYTKTLIQEINKLFVPSQDIRKHTNINDDDIKSQNQENEQKQSSLTNEIEEIKEEKIEHPHSKLSVAELAEIKIIDKTKAFIVGLPSKYCQINILSSPQWFGRFGKIKKDGVIIGESPGSISTDSRFVTIHYEEESSVVDVINSVNNYEVLDDGRCCKATYGYTYYCPFYRKYKKPCLDSMCRQRHNWCNLNEVITDEMLKLFRKMPGGPRTKNQKYWNSHIGKTSRELSNINNMSMVPVAGSGHRLNPNAPEYCMYNNGSSVDIMSREQLMSQQMQINALTQQIQMIRAEAVHQQTTWKHHLENKSNEYQALRKAYNALQIEHDALQIRYCTLDAKCIKLEKELTKQIEKAGRRKKDDDDDDDDRKEEKINYMDWDFNDVYLWILAINDGYFEKYTKVYDNLKLENIDGCCLNKLDKADVHRIGITDFRDKLLLMEKIQKLICNASV